MKRQVVYEVGTPDSIWTTIYSGNATVHFVTGEETVMVTITAQMRDTIIERLTAHKAQQDELARKEAMKLLQGDDGE